MGKVSTVLVLGGAIAIIALIVKKYNLCDSEPINPKPFYIPIDVAVDAAGEHLYVVSWKEDEVGANIFKFNLKTRKLDNLGSNANPPFKRSTGVAVDRSGNVYVADTENSLVRKIDAKTDSVTNLGGSVEFYIPVSAAVDENGNVYVSDYGDNTVRKIAPSGEVSTLGTSADPPFKGTQALALDDNGNVYVADSVNKLVRKINAKDGSVENVEFSNGIPLSLPLGVVVDESGSHVYVADNVNKLVRKIDVANKSIKNLGTTADPKIVSPINVAVDKKGNVYFIDAFYKSVRRIDAITDEVTNI
jgi:DNA-binding beta-propeller fold protein YncE